MGASPTQLVALPSGTACLLAEEHPAHSKAQPERAGQPGEGLASMRGGGAWRGAGGRPGSESGVTNPVTLGSSPPAPLPCTHAAGPVGLTPWDSRHRPYNMLLRFHRPFCQGQRHHPTWRWRSLCVSLASKNTSSWGQRRYIPGSAQLVPLQPAQWDIK